MLRNVLVIVLFFAAGCATNAAAMDIALVLDVQLPNASRYGIEKLEDALRTKGARVGRESKSRGDAFVIAGLCTGAGPAATALRGMKVAVPNTPESLVVRRTTHEGKPAVILCGSDARGLMYAALDIADRVSWAKDAASPFRDVRDASESPFVRDRGVSMYTMQRAYFESRLYDEKYWNKYFDLLARSRFNNFVVIFGYENGGFMAPPYPYFFDTPGFPEVKLVGLTRDQQERNTAAFRRLIDIAHERGIKVTAAIWDHIYRGGVQGGGIPGASALAGKETLGLVSGVTTENLMPYTKTALRKFLEVFPAIDSLQFRMHSESGLKPTEMQGFWHEVFADIRQTHPNLRIDLRVKDLPDAIIQDALDQHLNAQVSTKYWMEQMGLPFHPTHVNKQNQQDRRHGYADLLRYPQTYKVHWQLWNGGTSRLLSWADPEYVRRFAASVHLYDGDSFDVNEMLATWMLGEPHDQAPMPVLNPRYRSYEYEFERYWPFYRTWGLVSYSPSTSGEVLDRDFQHRFGAAATDVMQALQLASRVLPRIVAASYEYRLFPTTRGWAEMMTEGSLAQYAAQMEATDTEQFMNVRDAAKAILGSSDTAMRRPEETSEWFSSVAEQILAHAKRAGDATTDKEARAILTDAKILAWLARFHAARLNAAVAYNMYKSTGDLFTFDDAVEGERKAVAAWREMVEAAGDLYSSELPFGVHAVGFPRHWREELGKLEAEFAKLQDERKAAKSTAAEGAPRIAHVPTRWFQPGLAARIRATVTAKGGVKSVEVIGANPDARMRMREVAPGMYAVDVTLTASEFSYRIEAIGNDGTQNVYPATGWVTVRRHFDNKPPDVKLQPSDDARPGEDFVVRARVEDASGVKSVRLRYRHVNQYEDYRTVTMQADGGSGLYAGVIPRDFITPRWDLMYFVEAIDNQGNGRIYPDLDKETPYVVVPVKRTATAAAR